MFDNIATQIEQFIASARFHLDDIGLILMVLWIFNILNWVTGRKYVNQGVHPRTARGLVGIILAPFIHSHFNHLFFNSIPLFVLGLFIYAQGSFWPVTIIIILLSGLMLWLFGRKANHVGASGLITGYFSYVLFGAYQEPTITTIFCATIALYYFGSMFLGILPLDAKKSWEGHLFGFIAGVFAWFMMHGGL